MNKYIKFMALGAELTGLVVASVFLAGFIGEKLGSRNIGMFWGVVISFTVWFYRIILIAKKNK